jgi:tetratricopeptide (TPR) repeat protein
MMQKLLFPITFVVVTFLFSCTAQVENTDVETQAGETVDSVLVSFNEQIKNNPKDASLYFGRAKHFFEKRKDVDGAMSDMARVFLLDSTKTEYYVYLSDLYLTKGLFPEVKSTLETGLVRDEENIDARMKLAEMHLYLREHKECLSNLDRVLRKDRYNAKAYFIKGMAFKEVGDTAKAVSSFHTTVEQDPDYFHAYMQLGLLYSLKNNKIALDYLNSAIKIKPTSIEAWYAAGKFCQDNGMIEKAKEAYHNILEIDPEYKHAHYNLGFIHSEYMSDYKMAIQHFSNAIQYAPDFHEAHYMRGFAYERLGDKKNAAINYTKSLQVEPDYTLAAIGLGRVK